jgi:alpha-tubulin suppressor-like RCC1 family protein
VVARHPVFYFAYAPGQIVKQSNEDTAKLVVRFADFSEHTIERGDMYRLDKWKLQYDIESIKNIETSWVGHQHCLAYNPISKAAEPGMLKK